MSICDLVCPGVYIGNYDAACDKILLDELGISHILTVAEDLEPQFPNSFNYLIIEALDVVQTDLFKSFDKAFEFITSALVSGKVLVHCLMGISRSSTIVLSYLMRSQNIQLQPALDLLLSVHPMADPNSSFISQLKKLESLLVTSIQFNTALPYLCKICRTELFTQDDLVAHTSQDSKKFNRKRHQTGDQCSSLFIRKLDWMGECESNSGKLSCQYCLNKLGDYCWAGRQCSCGKFVTPAFQVHSSAVDSQQVSNNYISVPKKWTNKYE